MKKGDFELAINVIQRLEKFNNSLLDVRVDISSSDFYSFGVLADLIWKSNYTDEGVDYINWFIYESNDEDIEDVYNYVESNCKL